MIRSRLPFGVGCFVAKIFWNGKPRKFLPHVKKRLKCKTSKILNLVGMDQKVELKDFISKHYQLIATIGVFGALTALFVRFEGVQDIAFISLLIFFVLMWELTDSFPEIKIPLTSSLKLLIFEFLMIILLMAVGWYILVTYVSVYYEMFAFAIFLGLYSMISMKIVLKIRLFERIHDKIEGEPYRFVRFILLLVIFGIVMVLSSNSANLLINLIENVLT